MITQHVPGRPSLRRHGSSTRARASQSIFWVDDKGLSKPCGVIIVRQRAARSAKNCSVLAFTSRECARRSAEIAKGVAAGGSYDRKLSMNGRSTVLSFLRSHMIGLLTIPLGLA